MNELTKHRVFLVDDHPLVREWLTQLINQQPDLEVCGDAEDATCALTAIGKTQPDIAIVDLSLKDVSGLELVKQLKSQFPEVLILVLSMHDESLYAERAIRAGARGYIMKRETAKRVVTAIHQVLEGKLYLSEAFAINMVEKSLTRNAETASPIRLLSDRELEVFQLIGQGLETRAISERINVNFKTVQCYCGRIKEKLRLNTMNEVIREAVRWEDNRQHFGDTPPAL